MSSKACFLLLRCCFSYRIRSIQYSVYQGFWSSLELDLTISFYVWAHPAVTKKTFHFNSDLKIVILLLWIRLRLYSLIHTVVDTQAKWPDVSWLPAAGDVEETWQSSLISSDINFPFPSQNFSLKTRLKFLHYWMPLFSNVILLSRLIF